MCDVELKLKDGIKEGKDGIKDDFDVDEAME